jgi:hypothetical protein
VHITSYYNSTDPFEVRVSDIAYARVGFWDKTLPQQQPTLRLKGSFGFAEKL